MSTESGFDPTGNVDADTTVVFAVSDEDGHFGQSQNVNVYFVNVDVNPTDTSQPIGVYMTDIAGVLHGDFNLTDTGVYGDAANYGIFATNFVAGEDGNPDTGSSFSMGGLHVNDPNPPPPPSTTNVVTRTGRLLGVDDVHAATRTARVHRRTLPKVSGTTSRSRG